MSAHLKANTHLVLFPSSALTSICSNGRMRGGGEGIRVVKSWEGRGNWETQRGEDNRRSRKGRWTKTIREKIEEGISIPTPSLKLHLTLGDLSFLRANSLNTGLILHSKE